MLKSLKIKNIGLIDDISVDFSDGLNIITGETGAGKSMVLSALNLVLGGRADYSNLKDKNKDGSAEAIFDFGKGYAISDFQEQGIEPEEGEYIIRRTLPKSGKSRLLVNGSAVTLAVLKTGGEKIVDIHGQHDHQTLLKKESHLKWLDLYLELTADSAFISELLKKVKATGKELEALNNSHKEAEAKKEFLEFKVAEINDAELIAGEENELEANQKRLANAEKIQEIGTSVFESLYSADDSVLSKIDEASRKMGNLKNVDPFFEKQSALFAGLASQISDGAMETASHCSSAEDDPLRLEGIEARQSLIETLKRKYGAKDTEELISIKDDAEAELDSILTSNEDTARLENELAESKSKLSHRAIALHKKRVNGISKFEKEVVKELSGLNMGDAKFEVEIKLPEVAESDGYLCEKIITPIYKHGFGQFQFLISTNKGQETKPIAKIASGGEISRVMLGLKSATGKIQPVPVLVFDEIDAGIGGKTADMVGEKLKKLSKNCQIFCITHLSQIARQADRHLVVAKSSKGKSTTVDITALNDEERVEELARMQAGKNITDSARQHAREMIQS